MKSMCTRRTAYRKLKFFHIDIWHRKEMSAFGSQKRSNTAMKIINVIAEDFVNYKKPSMYIGFPRCTFKCEKECGLKVCQNSELVKSPVKDVPAEVLVNFYDGNSITEAVILAGLEPLDSFDDVAALLDAFLEKESYPDIVIYTGYKEDEVKEMGYFDKLMEYVNRGFNVVIKYGRFIPNQPHIEDPVLGVELASDNQYAKMYKPQ